MAILKKKMAGKPAMMKKKSPMRKAQNGEEVDKGETKTGEVKVRPGFGKTVKGITEGVYKTDFLDAKDAKTKVGKFLRKAGNTVLKAAFTPGYVAGVLPAAGIAAADRAIRNQKDLNKMPEKKMGGKVAKKVAPKMMIKKTTSKKKK